MSPVPWWRTLLAFTLYLVFLVVVGAVMRSEAVVDTLGQLGAVAFGVLAGKSSVEHVARGRGKGTP